jgi:hypothetical protein
MARRAGALAIDFERLCARDDYTRHEAIETLLCRYAGQVSYDELDALADQLRLHRPPPPPTASPSTSTAADAALRRAAVDALTARVGRRLTTAVSMLANSDRAILRQVHVEARTIREVAREAGRTDREMYRRIERIHRGLKRRLLDQGVAEGDVRDVLHERTLELDVLGSLRAAVERQTRGVEHHEARSDTALVVGTEFAGRADRVGRHHERRAPNARPG